MEDRFKYVVATVMLTAFAVIVYALAFRTLPESNKDVFMHLIGIVEGVVLTLVSYYFGTSKTSADKQEHIKRLTTKDENKD